MFTFYMQLERLHVVGESEGRKKRSSLGAGVTVVVTGLA
jgi:hypothetical protein